MTPAIFFGAMAAMGVLSIVLRNPAMFRTVAAMAGCAAAGLLWRYVIVPDSDWPWLTYAIIDAAGAAIIIRHPACRWQGWVGLCFLIQFAMNIGYGAAVLRYGYSYDAAILAYEGAGLLTIAKLICLGGWGGLSILDFVRRRARLLFHYPAHRQDHGGTR